MTVSLSQHVFVFVFRTAGFKLQLWPKFMLSSSLVKERKSYGCVCMCLYSYRFTTERFPRPGEQASAEVNGKIVDHAGQITKQMAQIVISSGIATLDKLL